MAVQLTVDLKPDLPREAARIRKFKGRVFALKDEPEVTRVWLPTSNSPGLAMARAFGDFCLKDFGLISIPDVYYHHITERDEFVILATDGVWDVLSNEKAVDIVASAPDCGTATRALVDHASRAWRFKYPASKNDDCAAICLFLKHVSSIDVLEARNGVTKAHEEDDLKKILVPTPADMEISNKALAGGIVHSCATTNESSVILPVTDVAEEQNDVTNADKEKAKKLPFSREEDMGISDEARATEVLHSDITESSEIVPVVEEMEKLPDWPLCQFKRSLAECLSTADDEWSALEGIARVNSLLSLPRLSSKS
ncbi:probable protein phosphatase 2C 66 [Olea europaea var. sylvestris]|uniref:probable protein phosphatase 2C 66 n=1 Tax=Olea europaea var. sylvestris TaxID=158386 RepID=UPI000C1CD6FD|nr:probable protein phosphatase 2C 66 [Olea europaea var. sylvestris]